MKMLKINKNTTSPLVYAKTNASRNVVTIIFLLLTMIMILSSVAIVDEGYYNHIIKDVNAQEAETTEQQDPDDAADEQEEKEISEAKKLIKDRASDFNKSISDEEKEKYKDTPLSAFTEQSKKEKHDTLSFGFLVDRLIGIHYINENHNGINRPPEGKNCHLNDPLNGTLLYHNCDVPNAMTSFFQKVFSSFAQFGPQEAEKSSAAVGNQAFGLPDNIPNGGAPANPRDRNTKYTALELFGYNLHYTSYRGEWDSIKTQNSSRAMTSLGVYDRVKATFKAFTTGLANSANVAVRNFTKELHTGNVLGAVGGFFWGLFKGAFNGTLNSIFDTWDQQNFDNYAWYRDDFGATLYGARALSQEELATELQKLIIEYLGNVHMKDVELPEDLKSISRMPEMPINEISKCSAVKQTLMTQPPGVTELECIAAHKAWEQLALASGGAVPPPPPYEYDPEGIRKREPLSEYINNYPGRRDQEKTPDYFNISQKYGVKCIPDPENGEQGVHGSASIGIWDNVVPLGLDKRNEFGSRIQRCWEEGYEKAVTEYLKSTQNEANATETKKAFHPKKFQRWVEKDEDKRNYNAPWRRYICLNEDGTDMKQGDDFVFLYTGKSGQIDPRCKEPRNPIQNGLFGNGYVGEQPEKDTRNITKETDPIVTMITIDAAFNRISNAGLWVSVFTTRVSNTMINFAYGTTLDKIGLDKVILKAMEELKDGVYYPLLAISMALFGFVVFLRILKERKFNSGFGDFFHLLVIMVVGITMLNMPDKIIKAVEEVPATIEQGVLTAIFNPINPDLDNLCTTEVGGNTTTKNSIGKETLSGNIIRQLTCENWRAGVYTPYVYGQWGTSHSELENNKMQNTNGSKVGDASVYLGGGQYSNNWALYQVDVLSSGTATDSTPDHDDGAIPRDFYRIIDMQAGINNGAGTDGRYFYDWTGQSTTKRAGISMLGVASSTMTMLAVGSLALSKIYINLVMTILLLIMPFMLLLGLQPTSGRQKMKSYFRLLLALGIQRITIAIMLGIMFSVMISITTATPNAIAGMLGMIAISGFFFMERKTLFNFIMNETNGGGQGDAISRLSDPDKVHGYLYNKTQRMHWGANAIIGGAIGGYAAGGAEASSRAVNRAFNSQVSRIRRLQRYRGKGPTQTFTEAVVRGGREARADLGKDPAVTNALQGTSATSKQANKEYNNLLRKNKKDMNIYDAYSGEVLTDDKGNEIGKRTPEGKFIKRPSIMSKETFLENRAKNFDTVKLSSKQARKIAKNARKVKGIEKDINISLSEKGIYIDENGDSYKVTDSKLRKKLMKNPEMSISDTSKLRKLNLEEKRYLEETIYNNSQQQENYNTEIKKHAGKAMDKDIKRQKRKEALRLSRIKLGDSNNPGNDPHINYRF